MFKKHIRARLIATIAIMVLALFVVNAFVSTKNVRSYFTVLSDEKCAQEANYYAEVVNNWFSYNEAVLKTAADSARVNQEDISSLRPVFAKIVDANDSVSEIYYVKKITRWSSDITKHRKISLRLSVRGLSAQRIQVVYIIPSRMWIRFPEICVSLWRWLPKVELLVRI